MNNLNGISVLGVLRLIKRNIIICLLIIVLFISATLLLSKVLFSSFSVKSTAIIRTNNIDIDNINYISVSSRFRDTVLGFIKTDAVLESVASKYETTTKSLQRDINYSYTGELVTITFDGGKSFENGIEILNDIVVSWKNYISNTEVSDVKGYIDIQSKANLNSDLTKNKKVFMVSMSFVGVVAAFVFVALKGIYGKRFEDESIIISSMGKQPIGTLKSKNKNIPLEKNKDKFDYIIYQLVKNNSKVVSIVNFEGEYTKNIVENIKARLNIYNKNPYIINLCSSNDIDIENSTKLDFFDKEIDNSKIINELKDKYDYIFIISSIDEGPLKNSFIIKESDYVIFDLQVGKSKKKHLNDFKLISEDKDLSYIITK